ncbi:predicted protein [Phaeodactylum tricornutum CCAP 1055/1]|jgi:large subunit ribosomal protein L23|uniref:Large ribosomal subunit protein uL23m n=2 Tax=Phaeodactylum tricornutum TaxID=2850 RepID=B7FPJ8_PHATC|nr:predicted protein [Phaeodactylum tricornutum CCAP 1055/1]EEC51686.1 predicted protein [Phaeodactylum tricornutum CCAP 1055/1]|eukprot:XP_002177223.1 predicted protein [Phaeodactylum tricornutum CCAP 1055/1]
MKSTLILAARAAKQFRMWMPSMPLTMVSARSATANGPAFAIFRTVPRMTKHEIKEYLTKIYDLPVKKVNTMNYEGKRKRLISNSGIAYFKYKNFKKAVVTFDDSLQDVGLGMQIPELEEQDESTLDYAQDMGLPRRIGS